MYFLWKCEQYGRKEFVIFGDQVWNVRGARPTRFGPLNLYGTKRGPSVVPWRGLRPSLDYKNLLSILESNLNVVMVPNGTKGLAFQLCYLVSTSFLANILDLATEINKYHFSFSNNQTIPLPAPHNCVKGKLFLSLKKQT